MFAFLAEFAWVICPTANPERTQIVAMSRMVIQGLRVIVMGSFRGLC